MLLVIDVGNSNIVLGIYDGNQLLKTWRIHTDANRTEDEFFVMANQMFSQINLDVLKIKKIVVASVVPPMANIIDSFCRKYIGKDPHWVSVTSPHDMVIPVHASRTSRYRSNHRCHGRIS